jgi:intergrase/recombinase
MLEQILAKLNLKSIDELKPAERATWQQWARILSKTDVTIEELKKFLPQELERATIELRKHENSPQKDSYYKAYGDIISLLTKFITSPEKEREQLKAMLKQKYGLE